MTDNPRPLTLDDMTKTAVGSDDRDPYTDYRMKYTDLMRQVRDVLDKARSWRNR